MELVAIETKPYRRDGVKRKHKNILGVGSQKDTQLNKFQCGIFAMHSLAEAEQIAQNVLNKGIGVIKNDEIALGLNLIKWRCQCVKRQNGAVFEGFVGKAQIYREAYRLVARDEDESVI